ncbi:unnamed protein product [Lactuca virosa]|uniref:Uncharacterized protein n=1 Tax=Lactuca virosa TaxID=75947 RepID=A0AAU9LFQ7_9ASTR|nr:unnamed protein product [Lactuca virosa]
MFYGAVYKNTYKYLIQGMNGSNMWPPTDFIPPLPPMKRSMPGRPKVNRRRDASEKLPRHTVSKVGKKISCSVCKNVGHNKVTCPQAERPQVQKPEVGRRPKLNVKKRKTGVNEKGEGAGGVNEGQNGQGAKSVHEGKKGQGAEGVAAGRRCKRKKSERIIKMKLAKRVKGKDGKRDTSANPLELND